MRGVPSLCDRPALSLFVSPQHAWLVRTWAAGRWTRFKVSKGLPHDPQNKCANPPSLQPRCGVDAMASPSNCVPSPSIGHSSAQRALDPPSRCVLISIACLVTEPVQSVYARAARSVLEPSSATLAATSHDAPKQVGSTSLYVSID